MICEDLISVIIPVFNSEKYVRRTLDSIMEQTYEKLEILLIDDGSTDGSGAICDEYLSDCRVKVFHRENAGVAASRQFGVDICSGMYYVSIDADDYVSSDYVEKLYEAIKENEADISVCGISVFTDGMNNMHAAYMPKASYDRLAVTKEVLVSDFYRLSTDMLLSDTWNKMYRTQFVKGSGVRYELPNIYNGSDLKFNHRLTMHCPVYGVCHRSLLYHRNHEGSRVSRKDKPLQEGFELITESLMEEAEKLGLSMKDQLSDIYYWLIGLVVMDIHYRGGNIQEKHVRFGKMIRENRRFLKEHRNGLEKHTGLKLFKMGDSVVRLPAFILGNALWLDIASLCIRILQRLKSMIREK